jgi:hypothetical protein
VGVELFHGERRMDWRTDITMLIAVFRNFANAPKTYCRVNSYLFEQICLSRCVQTILRQGTQNFIVVRFTAARGQITLNGTPNRLNYCVIFTVRTQFKTWPRGEDPWFRTQDFKSSQRCKWRLDPWHCRTWRHVDWSIRANVRWNIIVQLHWRKCQTLKKEAVYSSEILVSAYQSTGSHIPDGCNLIWTTIIRNEKCSICCFHRGERTHAQLRSVRYVI